MASEGDLVWVRGEAGVDVQKFRQQRRTISSNHHHHQQQQQRRSSCPFELALRLCWGAADVRGKGNEVYTTPAQQRTSKDPWRQATAC